MALMGIQVCWSKVTLTAEKVSLTCLVAILAQVVVGNPRRLEPRWNSHPDRAGLEFRLTRVLSRVPLSMA